MNNKENYKKSIEQIHASEALKNKTFEKITQSKSKKIVYMKYLSACAAIVIVFSGGLILNKNLKQNTSSVNIAIGKIEEEKVEEIKNDLPRFKDIEELKNVLKKIDTSTNRLEIADGAISLESATTTTTDKATNSSENKDYSTTNTQVENVDEADIVKTDGNYIYYTSNNKVYIVKADELIKVSEIEVKEENKNFYPREIYINKDKLIILGNSNEYKKVEANYEGDVYTNYSRVSTNSMAEAIVYDIKDRENPKQIRRVGLDGHYINSRMIGDNIYFISNKYANYYKNMEDYEILPILKDTAVSNDIKRADVTDIAYFEDSESYTYMLVAGFNINNNEKASTEIFFGASDTVYASQENLYIAQANYGRYYNSEESKTTIYKFNLDESKIVLQCKGEIKGNLNNQFSMDEYEGNLRVATTLGFNDDSTNQLYVLDKDLNQIGKIENMAKGEKIYSVRFIGKIGYIVTFKQIDPLFVIDLSEPTNPQVKGELKIPGYSSYLHPYDETHIIGIGYNTKTNSNGGITNTTLKMSMFDVSDLENPKEMFNVSIGEYSSYSNVLYNHKQLFYNKQRSLIGFPVTLREYDYRDDKDAFVVFEIDLEEGFKKFGEIAQKINYLTNIERAIYIENVLYTLSDSQIISYDLNTLEQLKKLELDYESNDSKSVQVMIDY